MKVLKFSAPWCVPCKQMDAQLEKLSGQFQSTIEHINTDLSKELVQKYNVRSVPTLIKLDSVGNEIARSMGPLTDVNLLGFLV